MTWQYIRTAYRALLSGCGAGARRLLLPGRTAAENAVFLSLILFGSAVRLVWLVDVPQGMHQDEASIGYEAWALLEHGVSRYGYRYPVHFIAWGSGQNALYAYLCMPFVKLLGLNLLAIRLPQALLGVAALFAMYAVGRRLVDGRFALCALFVLAVSPWHIMASRWAIESNVLPVVLLFAFALLLRGLERPRWVVPALAVFALALYAYGTAYVFVPLFTLGILAYGWRHHFRDRRYWGIGLAAMAAVALPIGLFLVVNLFDLPGIELPLLSVPRYTGETRLISESVFFAGDPLRELLSNAERALDFLVSGSTPYIHNVLPEFGYFYHPVGLGIMLAGVCLMAWDLVRGRHLRNLLVAMWLAAGLVVATLTEPHMQRLNVLLVPLLLCAAYGLYRVVPHFARRAERPASAAGSRWLVERAASVLGVAALAYLALSFAAFARHYFTEYGPKHSFNVHPSYARALLHVVEHARADDVIYLPKEVLYTAVLFYDPPAPRLYSNTVQFEAVDVKFQVPTRFGRYRFGLDAGAADGNAFVVYSADAAMFPASQFTVAPFDRFSAVIRRRHQD